MTPLKTTPKSFSHTACDNNMGLVLFQYILREFKITLKLFGIISQKHQHQYQHQQQHQLSITILGTAQVDNIILKEVPDQIIPHS